MQRILTTPVDTAQDVIAYWIVSPISDELAQTIADLQTALWERFSDAIWNEPRDSLHISFNALSPIFESNEILNAPANASPTYTKVFEELVSDLRPIELHFESIEAFPAAIILKAQDNGTYQHLREQFNRRVDLPANTKPTPNIIHTTICKFHDAIDLDEVKDFLSTKSIKIDMTVSEFRIVREKVLYMVDYDVLHRFDLINN